MNIQEIVEEVLENDPEIKERVKHALENIYLDDLVEKEVKRQLECSNMLEEAVGELLEAPNFMKDHLRNSVATVLEEMCDDEDLNKQIKEAVTEALEDSDAFKPIIKDLMKSTSFKDTLGEAISELVVNKLQD